MAPRCVYISMTDKRNIWVVDDDPIAVTIIRHLITGNEHFQLSGEFSSAEKMIEKLEADEKSAPDLIILDLNMPLMSGWDLLEHLQKRRNDAPIPVAVFTSSIDERDKERSDRHTNVIGHFVKPMTKALLAQIEEKLTTHTRG